MENKNIHDFLIDNISNLSSLIRELKVFGEPMYISKEELIIPLSKVTLGFGSGGSEYYSQKSPLLIEDNYPFGGGAIGGIKMIPEAFIYISNQEIKIVNIKEEKNIYEKGIEMLINVAKAKLKK